MYTLAPDQPVAKPLPRIIQGGMGAGVSGWRLARAVAKHGQLGVVSGTAIDLILARRLQDGDPGGDLRRALAAFPIAGMAERVLDTYFVPGGRHSDTPYRRKPLIGQRPSRELVELLVIANFVEVFLAKEGHDGVVGINYLQKIQAPTLPSIYGAMLAGVDAVIVGAGVPRAIPAILDSLARGEAVELAMDVVGASRGTEHKLSFDPATFWGQTPPTLRRPFFFPIVSSDMLARTMIKKSAGRVDGLIVEGRTAGGHNAGPRGAMQLDAAGEPIYGPRDEINLAAIAELGVPFWLAGSQATPERLQEALDQGAAGVQVGTLFAFCAESGLRDDLKESVLRDSKAGTVEIFTDPVASPTGFPFKVLNLEGTASQREVYESRERLCDLGYLRQAFERPDGSVGWRCPGEPHQAWQSKGGTLEETVGRKCLCNGLAANIGLAQLRSDGTPEPALLTAGDEVASIARFGAGYGADEVIDFLLGSDGQSGT